MEDDDDDNDDDGDGYWVSIRELYHKRGYCGRSWEFLERQF